MADWSGTLTFDDSKLVELETYIHEPYSRSGDIFDQGTLNTGKGPQLDWVIKHDLFQGVILHLNLMTEDNSAFLAGQEEQLSKARDLLNTYTLKHDGRTYQITIKAG